MKILTKIHLIIIASSLFLVGCNSQAKSAGSEEKISAGLLVTENGLGDNSFSDSAFTGLQQARDELGITFDYREPFDKNYEKNMQDLIEQGHDVIIGLSYNAQPAIEKLAEAYPDQSFVLVDAVSEKDNVTSITFKEDEGSYLIGLIAGMKTKSNTVGFIGGEKIPVVQRFEKGFKRGVKEANPEAQILTSYAGTFNDDQKGASIARDMIEQQADYLFPSAGFTGVGVLKEAQEAGVYAFGVDSDQFYIAEKAVVSSMLKNLNVALYDVMQQLVNGQTLKGGTKSLGLEENGVGIAPIRLIQLSPKEKQILEEAKAQ